MSMKLRWAYADKEEITNFVRDYKEEWSLDALLDNTEQYASNIMEYRKTREFQDMAQGGYGKFPLYYLHDDFGAYRSKLNYSQETHRMLWAIGAFISTFVNHGRGLKSATLTSKFGIPLAKFKDIIDAYGFVYGLEWFYEFDQKQQRNRHYVKFNNDYLLIKSNELKKNKGGASNG